MNIYLKGMKFTYARNIIFYLLAFCCFLAAIYHFVALFTKVDESPIWRHALFVCINVFCIYGCLSRPKFFIYFVVLLFLQQYYSHGSYLFNYWKTSHHIHWKSLLVLVLLPVGLICFWKDRKAIKLNKKL